MLNKEKFVDYIAENYGTTKKNAKEIIEIFTAAFKKASLECGGVGIVGFGNTKVVDVKEREYVSPKTHEKIVKPAHTEIRFTISKGFKNMSEE